MRLDELCPELIHEINDYLSVSSALYFGRTCRKFHKITLAKVWSHICVSLNSWPSSGLKLGDPEPIVDRSLAFECDNYVIKIHPRNARSYIDAYTEGWLGPRLARITRLTILDGDVGCLGDFSKSNLEFIFDKIIQHNSPRLHTIQLNHSSVNSLSEMLQLTKKEHITKLVQLNDPHGTQFTPGVLQVLSGAKSLKMRQIIHGLDISDSQFAQSLKSLQISVVSSIIPAHQLKGTLSKFPNLEHFSLAVGGIANSQNINWLPESIHALKLYFFNEPLFQNVGEPTSDRRVEFANVQRLHIALNSDAFFKQYAFPGLTQLIVEDESPEYGHLPDRFKCITMDSPRLKQLRVSNMLIEDACWMAIKLGSSTVQSLIVETRGSEQTSNKMSEDLTRLAKVMENVKFMLVKFITAYQYLDVNVSAVVNPLSRMKALSTLVLQEKTQYDSSFQSVIAKDIGMENLIEIPPSLAYINDAYDMLFINTVRFYSYYVNLDLVRVTNTLAQLQVLQR